MGHGLSVSETGTVRALVLLASKRGPGRPPKRPCQPNDDDNVAGNTWMTHMMRMTQPPHCQKRAAFWRELCFDAQFKVNCSEYLVLAELALVMVPASVEDERLFSAMNFIKNDLRNSLKNPHLTAAVRLFFSRQFTVETFPYMEALKAWRVAAAKRGRYTGTGHK